MIPTFVTAVPDGSEKGTFLAVDLGGTNFRVCSITLKGDSTFDLVQEKEPIPPELMKTTSDIFFGHLADKIEHFIQTHHCDTFVHHPSQGGEKEVFKMGFTFSFPVDQTSINSGSLIRWTKGFDIKDAVGKDICALLQAQIDKRNLPVHVAALVNDTVGTLMSRSYTKPSGGRTLVGCIFGTGTNGAYSERIKHIPKFDASKHPEITDKIMVINTEWGSFDNDLKVLPNTKYDVQLNKNSPNVDFHMFEKRVSGMFLGELLRLALADLHSKKLIFASSPSTSEVLAANLYKPWSTDTSVPSKIDKDDSSSLEVSKQLISLTYGYDTTLQERQDIQLIVKAIGKRSAYLAAVPLAGLIIKTRALQKFDIIDIGADGSVVEHYPNFQQMIREALRKTSIGSEESRITIGIAKDGSGVGAALCALVSKA